MKILMVMILFIFSSCVTAQNQDYSISSNQKEVSQNQSIEDVSLCELVKNPEKFEKKFLRIKAIYAYGFEWSTLYSTKCEMKKRIWVESKNTKCENTDEVDEMENAGMGGRTVGVIVVGQFIGEGKRYGNMNSYEYLFKVKCYDKAKMLDRKNSLPDAPGLKRKIEEFENSN